MWQGHGILTIPAFPGDESPNQFGTSFTVTAGGSGYTSAPQIVISGGGWRYTDDSSQDNLEVGASDGIIIYRGATGGVKSFIEAANPTAD